MCGFQLNLKQKLRRIEKPPDDKAAFLCPDLMREPKGKHIMSKKKENQGGHEKDARPSWMNYDKPVRVSAKADDPIYTEGWTVGSVPQLTESPPDGRTS